MSKHIAVLSVSGGMDSTGLILHMLNKGYDLNILSFNYGQKHKVELERLAKNIDYFKQKGFKIEWNIGHLDGIMGMFHSALIDPNYKVPEGHYADENMKQTVVPNRNAIFSSIIFGYALSIATKTKQNVLIGLGVHNGDFSVYPDCRPEFFDAIEHAFKIGNWESERVNYYLPYENVHKFDILKDAKECCENLKLDFETIFRNTNTCYQPNEKGESCGKCGSCTERLEAFAKLGVKDPVEYQK